MFSFLFFFFFFYSLCPPNRRGGGHIVFGADPVGVRVAPCLYSFSRTNGWILTKLAQTHYWENWLDFGDLDLFFKKSLSAPYLLNQMTDSGQTSYILTLGWFKDLIRFWWPWPNFQGHHTIKTLKFSNLWPKKACLHPISWTKWWILAKLHIL